jgi:hypothetical protein
MKKVINSVLLAIVLLISLQLLQAQTDNQNVESNFKVEFQKSAYLLLEPVVAKLTLPVGVKTDCHFREETLVKITFESEIKEFNGISSLIITCCGMNEELPRNSNFDLLLLVDAKTGKPLKTNEQKPAPMPKTYETYQDLGRLSEFFPKPGKYEIQFVFGKFESNKAELIIEEPTGINKEAFSFLNKYVGNSISYDWVWSEKNGIALLEEFVAKYGKSVYGDQAISYLGNIYKLRDDVDKAQTEFEKIKTSDNKLIADEAKKALEEIKARKICLEKTKAQKP